MRIHGKRGIAYLSVNSGDPASPVAFLSSWELVYARALLDTTAEGDVQVSWATKSADLSGMFSGFYDSATAQTYAAAADGLPRNMYLYPSTWSASHFFSGLVVPDYSLGGGVAAAVPVTVNWGAAGPVTRTVVDVYDVQYDVVYS